RGRRWERYGLKCVGSGPSIPLSDDGGRARRGLGTSRPNGGRLVLDAMRLGVGTMIAAVAAGGAYLLAQAAPADRAVTSCEALPARIAAAGSGDVHRIDLPRGARCTMPP